MSRAQLILPCFNEARRLPVQTILAFVRSNPDFALILVNDGSSDGTEEVLEDLAGCAPQQIQALHLGSNRGKAEAVRQGILAAIASRDAPFVGYWDADLATPLEEAPRFLDLLQHTPRLEMVLGSRVRLLGRSIERRWQRHYFGRIFATGASLALDLPVYDTQCGAKLFRVTDITAELFSTPFLSPWVFDVEILARLAATLRRRNDSRPADQAAYEIALDRWSHVPGSKVRPWDFVTGMVDLARIRLRYR